MFGVCVIVAAQVWVRQIGQIVPMRDSICIYCSQEDRARLQRLVADRNTPRKVVWRR